jgi:hypothetical protein
MTLDWNVMLFRPEFSESIDSPGTTRKKRRDFKSRFLDRILDELVGGDLPRACNDDTHEVLPLPLELAGRAVSWLAVRLRPKLRIRKSELRTENPLYLVRWGDWFETTEFSKHYRDGTNPQKDFAALMVCSEADAGCPFVRGASLRVSMPYLDPRIYDDGSYEAAKYAERRDDMGRMMLSVMMRVRNRLFEQRKLGETTIGR